MMRSVRTTILYGNTGVSGVNQGWNKAGFLQVWGGFCQRVIIRSELLIRWGCERSLPWVALVSAREGRERTCQDPGANICVCVPALKSLHTSPPQPTPAIRPVLLFSSSTSDSGAKRGTQWCKHLYKSHGGHVASWQSRARPWIICVLWTIALNHFLRGTMKGIVHCLHPILGQN